MSSNFTIKRKCVHCKKTFDAKTTVTRYCGKLCNKRHNAAKQRNDKLEAEKQRWPIILSPQIIQPVQGVEYLNTQKVALLLGVSRNLIYHLINTGKLNAYNLSIRKTILLKKDIDLLFQTRLLLVMPNSELPKIPKTTDCYNMGELHAKFGMSESAIYNLIKRYGIAKFHIGRFTYVTKKSINPFLLNQN
jgi:predicted DNA-binding transcriptional regulator AlpA